MIYRMVCVTVCAVICILGFAQNDLAKQSQNPLGTIISSPFENNTYIGIGPSDSVGNVMVWKPVYPISLGDWNMINRLLVPAIWSEGQESNLLGRQVDTGFAGAVDLLVGSASGLGDITYQPFFSPKAAIGGWTMGLAPVFVLPTATEDRFASDQWQAGLGYVALKMPGSWVVGVLLQNVWSVYGEEDAADINKFIFQYFVNYNFGEGWYLSTTPVNTANWEANSNERWTIPVGGGVGRMVRWGQLPVDLKLAGYYNVEKPEFGPEWNVQFTLKFLFPKK